MIRFAFIFTILLLTLMPGLAGAEDTAPADEASAAEAAALPDPAADLVVARVSGELITETQVLDTINELSRQENLTIEQSKQRNSLLFDRALESLITVSLMKTRAREMNIVIDESDVEAQLRQTSQRYPSPEAFLKALTDQGLTEADLRNTLRESIRMQIAVDEISKNAATVTEAEIEKFYAENPDNFALPERVRMAHILLHIPPGATPAQKEEIRKKLESIRIEIEADIITFVDAAAKYSQDENTAAKGGDMGFVSRGNLPKPFADALFNAKPGRVSPAMESQSGYHVLMALESRQAEHATLEEVKPSLRQALEENAKLSARQKFVDELKSKATIEYFMTSEEFAKRNR